LAQKVVAQSRCGLEPVLIGQQGIGNEDAAGIETPLQLTALGGRQLLDGIDERK
jgi:hypothetical protein